MIEARILADSYSTMGRARLTTFELTFPRFILPEFLTHRAISRNTASSRAIPTTKMIRRVIDNPAVPIHWGRNQKGMQASAEVDDPQKKKAAALWNQAMENAVGVVSDMLEVGVHKQVANRLLEPFLHVTMIASATDWDNFFHLRRSDLAQPEIHALADTMWSAYNQSVPRKCRPLDWHLPLADDLPEAMHPMQKARISAGRCARVSYLTHDGKRDLGEDEALCERLIRDGHWSPTEHQARANDTCAYVGNFRGFTQFRKFFRPDECVTNYSPEK